MAQCAPSATARVERGADIGRESEGKRRNEARRNDRRKLKVERRQERQSAEAVPVDEEAKMAQFHLLNEQRAAGTITEDDYEAQRREIFVALGLEGPDVDDDPSDDAERTDG